VLGVAISTASTTATRGAGVLSAHSKAPVVAKTAVSADLLKALQIVTEGSLQVIGRNVLVHTSLPLLLSVQEPQRDLKLGGVGNNSQHAVNLIRSQLTGTLLQVNVRLLADDVSEPTANTGDDGQGKHDLASTINVGIEKTQNMLEIRGLNKAGTS
jgi:hypothetical protein